MRTVVIAAASLKAGDVISGQRVNHEPVIHGGAVNILLINPHGYKMEHRAFAEADKLVVKRPVYNMSREAQKKRRKGRPVAAQSPAPTQTWDKMGTPTLIYEGSEPVPPAVEKPLKLQRSCRHHD